MFELSPLQRRALIVAKRHVGTREATGRNDGPLPLLVQRWVAKGAAWLDRQPWCACYATWAVHRAANELRAAGEEVEGPRIPPNASSSSLFRWFRAQQLLTPARPGTVGLVKGGPTGHRHTFLVHDVVRPAGARALSMLSGSLAPADVRPTDLVIGVDGNYRNAVQWSKRRVSECDFGAIV